MDGFGCFFQVTPAQVLAGSLRLLAGCVQVSGEHARWPLPSQLSSPLGHFWLERSIRQKAMGLLCPVQDQAEKEKERLLKYLK